jgi:hypothetical protein
VIIITKETVLGQPKERKRLGKYRRKYDNSVKNYVKEKVCPDQKWNRIFIYITHIIN